MFPSLQVHLLGRLQLYYQGKPITSLTSARLKTFFAYLILHRDKLISRQQLATLFWPDTTETQARTNLRNLIHQLHKNFPFFDEFIHADAQALGWRADSSYSLDIAAFEACLEIIPGISIQREMLERAVQIYTDELLPDCYDDWIVPERERLHRAFLAALEALAVMAEDAREYPAALDYAARLVKADPLHNSANHQLIRLHALLGNRRAALKAYQVYARLLLHELNAQPDAEIQNLAKRLQHLGRQESAPREIPAMVGRQTEWRAMQAACNSTLDGRQQILFISGEAGIGKSRLVEELAHWAGMQGVQTATAHCYPAEGQLPYAPVVSWLRSQPLPRLEKVWLTELARLLPEVRQNYSGLPREEALHEAWQRQRLFEALARALLARQRPQLLILEDIQWCDQDTLEWLHYLLRFAPAAPLLIAATLRNGEAEPEHPVTLLQSALRQEGKLVELKLRPLSEAETIELVNQVRTVTSGPSLSAAEAGEVYREAEGNPLFAIEMVRLGSVQPGLEPRRQDWLNFSERAQSVLFRRIGQISPATREITCLAATIGREFSLDVLREAGQGSDDQLVQAIDELLHRQIIREISPATPLSRETAVSRETYDFTHDLLRRAAFGGMSTAHRRLLHRKVADAYLRLGQATQPARDAEIASHYERAGLYPQAIEHYRLAAETAARIFANADAQRYLQRAITLAENSGLDTDTDSAAAVFAGLLERLGELLALDGKYAQAQACYERALAHKIPATNVWRSQIHRKISEAGVPQADHGKAHAALDQAEQALGYSPEKGRLAEQLEWLQIQVARMQLYYWQGQPEKMETIFQQIEPEIKATGRIEQHITLLSLQYMTRLRQERYRLSEETITIARRRLKLSQKYSSPYEQAVATFHLGFGLLWYGDPAAARAWLARAVAATRHVGTRVWQMRSLAYLTIADRTLGNLENVRAALPQFLELCASLNEYTYQGIGYANLGWLAWRQGDLEEAQRLCTEANQVWQKFGGSPFYWLADWVLLAIAVTRRDFPLAARLSQTFIEPQPKDQLPIEPAAGQLRLAISAWQAGDEAGALRCYDQALEQARAAREL